MNKKGFTLAELLAVFILLGIIAAIAFKVTGDIKEQAELDLLKTSARSLFTAADNYYADNDYKNFPAGGVSITNLNIQNTTFTDGKVMLDSNGKFILKGVTDGTYCINGGIDDLTITEEKCKISPIPGADRAYILLSAGEEANPITIADLPSSYENIEENIIVAYVNKDGFLVEYGEGMASTSMDDNEINNMKAQILEFSGTQSIHSYISTDLGFSYVVVSECDMFESLDGDFKCDGKSLNFAEVLASSGSTLEESGIIVIDF